MAETYDFSIQTLGEPRVPSPIALSRSFGDKLANYATDSERVIADAGVESNDPQHLQKAGPREHILFVPGHVHAAVLTCGGLCPGLNDVIRSIVRSLWYSYGVKRITGIRYGYNGFLGTVADPVVQLNPDAVDDIHKIGGSVLGSSRGGGERTADIVDAVESLNINMLFIIGGDGTQRGAVRICNEIARRGSRIAVVGIPKTIDNDFRFVDRSFGFETAVAEATAAVAAAHTESHSAINGVGLVKLMGRESGFIAAHTALAGHEANFVLIPEVPFDLEGSNGFLEHLHRRLQRRHHAVVIVAEGAGQQLFETGGAADAGRPSTDASGNAVLRDIGVYLRDRIGAHFKKLGVPINLKYIDPSYIIRSAVAVPSDAVYCSRLGTNAVHAAMAGKTRMLVGLVNTHIVHLPMDLAVATRHHVDPESNLWRDVLEAVHQPVLMTND